MKRMAAAIFGYRLIVARFYCINRQRYPKIGGVRVNRILKAGGHNADDGIEAVVEFNAATDDILVCAELLLPQRMTEDNGKRAARFLLFRRKASTEQRIGFQYGK